MTYHDDGEAQAAYEADQQAEAEYEMEMNAAAAAQAQAEAEHYAQCVPCFRCSTAMYPERDDPTENICSACLSPSAV